MPSLQLISQLFWACSDCTEYAIACSAIFLATYLITLEKEIHCKLQKSCYTLGSRAGTCNDFKTKVEPTSTLAVVACPKKLRNKLQRGHFTRCNVSATCLATPSQHKLQRKFHRVTQAVELGSTFFKDCRNSETTASCNPRLQRVTCLL